MKHAMILTAYNDFDVLEILLKYYSLRYDCYVHVDKKSKISDDLLQEIQKIQNVYLYSEYKINWGSYRHISAVMFLLQKAIKKKYDYYHILPANAFPVKKFEEFEKNFAENRENNYIEMIPVEGNNHLEERQRYYHFLHLYNLKESNGRKLQKYMIRLQDILNIRKDVLYKWKGYFYCHLTDAFVLYCIEEWNMNPNYIRSLKKTWCPEEFYFQNLIVDSPFYKTIINNPLIYSDWISNRGGVPACLDKTDLKMILEGEYLFARKVRDKELAMEIIKEIADFEG